MLKHVSDNESQQTAYSTEELLELLRALSDETRQQILQVFSTQKELCVNDIVKNFTLSRPTISHHLNIMRRVKLLNSRKEGKEIYFSLNKQYVINALESFLDHLKCCC